MECFAVIDTETTWSDQVMSIGVVIAEKNSFELVDEAYYIFTPECLFGGMYTARLNIDGLRLVKKSRKSAIKKVRVLLSKYGVEQLFAYNALFDKRHLPEFSAYEWFDIMKIAAYKQYNKKIPATAVCCGSGRMKRNYGVQPMIQLLTGNSGYCETHNALHDARDELGIIRLLGKPLEEYVIAKI